MLGVLCLGFLEEKAYMDDFEIKKKKINVMKIIKKWKRIQYCR